MINKIKKSKNKIKNNYFYISNARYSKGFTLIELLISIVIIGLLGAVMFFSLSKTTAEQNLTKETEIIFSYINDARSKAISNINNSEYGIKFATSSIVAYEGNVYPSSTSTTYLIASPITISKILLSGSSTALYFKKLTGEPSVTGTIVISNGLSSTTKNINISSTGIIQIQ